jgi:hypothetical protein
MKMNKLYNDNTFLAILTVLVILIFLYGFPTLDNKINSDVNEPFTNVVDCVIKKEIPAPVITEPNVFDFNKSKKIEVNKTPHEMFIIITVCFKELKESININKGDILKLTNKNIDIEVAIPFYVKVIKKKDINTLELEVHLENEKEFTTDANFNIELIGNTRNTLIYNLLNLEDLENESLQVVERTASKKVYNQLRGIMRSDIKMFKPRDTIKIIINSKSGPTGENTIMYGAIKSIDSEGVIKFTSDDIDLSNTQSSIPIIIQKMIPDNMIKNYIINNENSFTTVGYNNAKINTIKNRLKKISDLLKQ